MRVINIQSEHLKRLLENPTKNHLVICGHHGESRQLFMYAADDVVKNLPDLPIVIKQIDRSIRMPEGGMLMFSSCPTRQDIDRFLGYHINSLHIDPYGMSPGVEEILRAVIRIRP